MIRPFKDPDMDEVIEVWIEASEEAHDFVKPGFWSSRAEDMREKYIPMSETCVFEEAGKIRGFLCLCGMTVAALFVSPAFQGGGIGGRLMRKAKEQWSEMNLTVYKDNSGAVRFYKRQGFESLSERIDECTGQVEIVMHFPGQKG